MRPLRYSGISWYGDIPSDWTVAKIKNVFSVVSGSTPDSNNLNYWDGDIKWITPADYKTVDKYVSEGRKEITRIGYDSCGTTMIPKGSVIFSKRAPIGSVAINTVPLCTNQGCLSCIPQKTTSSLFYYYVMSILTEAFELYGSGTTFKEISAMDFSNFHIPFPPYNEQQCIANFLDRKCTDIDNVLRKTKSSIDEYKRLKQSVITEAVTKGIRGARPMKNSGSTWFDQIPNTWNANKLKYTFTIRKRIVGEDGHTVLAITQKGVKPKDMSNGNGQFAESYANYQIVHPGDFAMNHMDLLTGWVDISKYEGVTSPDYRVFTLDDTTRNCPSYYLYMMQMCYSNRIFYSMGQGVSGMGRWRLPADMFNNFIIACPPLEEQQEIAEYLDKKCSEIDSLIASKEKFITELESYKKSLIYEYVTGKKEVPAEA